MNEPGPAERPHGPAVSVDDRAVIEGPDPDSLGELLAAVLAAEGVPRGSEAGLHLVGIEEMTALNQRTMGEDGPTDVLSFPVDGSAPVDGCAPVNGGAPGDGAVVPHLVGDVVLCTEVAARNAATHAGTVADECRLLVVHGGLHLCGWDHSTPRQRDDMWRREREVMESLGVSPSGEPWDKA